MTLRINISAFVIIFSFSSKVLSQEKEDRIGTVKEFIVALGNEDLTNEDIVRGYMTSCCYLKDSSLKQSLDTFFDAYRIEITRYIGDNFVVLNYVEHEMIFKQLGHADEASFSPATLRPLRFYLDILGWSVHHNKPTPLTSDEITNIKDIYVFANKKDISQGKGAFILFEKHTNKILGITVMQKDNKVSMIGW